MSADEDAEVGAVEVPEPVVPVTKIKSKKVLTKENDASVRLRAERKKRRRLQEMRVTKLGRIEDEAEGDHGSCGSTRNAEGRRWQDPSVVSTRTASSSRFERGSSDDWEECDDDYMRLRLYVVQCKRSKCHSLLVITTQIFQPWS